MSTATTTTLGGLVRNDEQVVRANCSNCGADLGKYDAGWSHHGQLYIAEHLGARASTEGGKIAASAPSRAMTAAGADRRAGKRGPRTQRGLFAAGDPRFGSYVEKRCECMRSKQHTQKVSVETLARLPVAFPAIGLPTITL